MRAVRLYSAGDLRIEDIPDPGHPSGRDVRLEVELAGICGSDLHNYHTGQWISRAPSTPGHEFVARVVEVGNAVRTIAPGDRIVADSRVPCGICATCTAGRFYLCAEMGFVGEVNDGGFAPVSIQDERQLVRLPDQSVSPRIAALAEPLAVALHAVNRLHPTPGDAVLVLGAGTIGVLVAVVLKHLGIVDITLSDVNSERQAGASSAFDLLPFMASDAAAFDGCVDTTGSPAAFDVALAQVVRGGAIAVVGLYGRPLTLDMNRVVEGGLRVSGCAAFDGELYDAVGLLSSLTESLERIASTTVALDDVPKTYEMLSSGRAPVQKAFVDPFL